MASRSANMASPREPRLRTVVKPAISVRFAYIAARNEACTLLLVMRSLRELSPDCPVKCT